MGRVIGIDLGTTNSVVAVIDRGGCRVLQNREYEMLTRSAVGYYKNDFIVGAPALNRWPSAPKDTIVSIKRLMGRAITDTEVTKVKKWAMYDIVEPSDGTKDSVRVKLGGKEYSPVDISAIILKKLKGDAEFVLGEEVTHAVITVPAYFSEKQKHATREAALKAGLTVMKVIEEPTAAAIAYGIDSMEREAKTILVFDLGGGTFDIAILMMASGTFASLNVEGDMWLGGDDFDQVIVEYCVEKIKKEYGVDPAGNLRFMATLKLAAKAAKETLGQSKKADVFIPGILMGNDGSIIDIEIEIDINTFENLSRKLVMRTRDLTLKSIANAHMDVDDIDYVIMSGNATAMPMVQQTVEEMFGKDKILRKIHPKYCVAMGAAMTAAALRGIICPKCNHNNDDMNASRCSKCGTPLNSTLEKKNCFYCGAENEMDAEKCFSCGTPFIKVVNSGIAPFAYGIQSVGDKFNLYIEKGDGYETPTNNIKIKSFYTRYPNQRIISIPVYGGEYLDCASKNEKQGEAFAILPGGLSEGTEVLIKLWLDKEGLFDISTKLKDGTQLPSWILRGDADQKTAELLAQSFEYMAQIENIMPQEEKKWVDRKLDEILKKLVDGDYKASKEGAEELLDYIINGPQKDAAGKAAINISKADFIINNFRDLKDYRGIKLIPPELLYEMNNLIETIERETSLKNIKGIEEANKRLEDILDELSYERSGGRQEKKVPNEQRRITVIGALYELHLIISYEIAPAQPAKAQKFQQDYGNVVMAFRNADPGAMDMLEHLINEVLGSRQSSTITCWKCGHVNQNGNLYCDKCNANLYLPGSK